MTYRFRFVWNKARHHDSRARSIDGLYRSIESESTDGHFLTFWVDLRKLLSVLSISAVVLWFLAAGALTFTIDRNPYNRVGYFDVAFPWRWSHVRDLRGQGYIAAGLDEIKAGRAPAGIMEVRQGLARHPDAPTARLAVARVYARVGYYQGVREILLPQLTQSRPPREYIEFLVNAANISDDHATTLSVCDQLLAASDLPAADRNWLLVKKAEALVALERFPEALAALDAGARDSTMEWRRVHVLATIGSGRPAEAIVEINGWNSNVPADFRFQMLVRASRRARRFDETVAAVKQLQRLHPDSIEPWSLAIGEYVRAGWSDAAWEVAQDAILRFGADPKAMENLERVCSETRSVDLLGLCVEHAREQGQPALASLIDLTVALLQHGEQTRAEKTYEQALAEDRRLREAERNQLGSVRGLGTYGAAPAPKLPDPVRDWLRSLLDAVALPADDTCGVHTTVLENQHIPPALFAVSADVLAASGHWPALEILSRIGLAKYPGSTVLTRWGRVAKEKIAAMPKPAPVPASAVAAASAGKPARASADAAATALVPAVVKYGNVAQDQFFARIEEAAHRGAWADVENEIRNVISAAPPWLPQVQADLTWRQIRAALEQGEALRATLVMGERLRVHPLEAPRALALVREWQGRNERETARKLAESLVSAVPEFRPGQATLKEILKSDKASAPADKPSP